MANGRRSQKVDRYYVDEGRQASNIVIRDRISPLGKLAYSCDILCEFTAEMLPRNEMLKVAQAFCKLLNLRSK
jgi:hypothetical protein